MEYALQTKSLEKQYKKYHALRGVTMNVPKDLISVEDADCSGDVSMQSEIGDVIFDGTVMGDLFASTEKGSIDISGELDGGITLIGEESSNITLKLNGAPEKYNYSVFAPNGSILYNDEGIASKTLEKDNGADNIISIKGNGADVSITVIFLIVE